MCWVWGTLGSCPPGQTDDLVDRVREHGNQQNPIDTDAQASCSLGAFCRCSREGRLWSLQPGFGHLQPCQLPSGQQRGQLERGWEGQPTLRTVPRLYCVGGIASLAFCQRGKMAPYCEFRTLCLSASEGVCAGGCPSCPTSFGGLPARRAFPWLSSRRHSPTE